MTKLIMTGDPHICIGVGVPQGRNEETFYSEQRSKLDFIQKYAVENNVDAVITPGDLLNYKNINKYSAYTINALIDLFKGLQTQGIDFDSDRKVTWAGICGNHDIPQAQKGMKYKSVYGTLIKSKAIHDLNDYPLSLNTSSKKGSVKVYGIDYLHDPEELKMEIQSLANRVNPNDVNILVVHEHLYPNADDKNPFVSKFITYGEMYDLVKGKFKVVLSGHLHDGYQTERYQSCDIDSDEVSPEVIFVNPWSLTRLARGYDIAKHKPEIVVLTIDDDGQVSFEHVEVPHFGVETFKLDKLSEYEEELNIHEFVSQLNEFDEVAGSIDISNVDRKVADKIQYYLDMVN